MEPVIKLNPGATKWDIRQKVWDYIEANNLANFPRPVHNRIPNFKGACSAGDRLPALAEFKCSKVVKVNPDRPQQQARYVTLAGAHCACAAVADLEPFRRTSEVKVDPDKPLEGARLVVLQARKTLLVPTPRLRAGLFNRIVPPQGASTEDLRVCSTSQGVKNFSVPVGLDAKVSVDLVVVGSVAVSQKGYRIGKGEGYADMEYAMMASMGAVSSATVVVTVVHDCQVVDIPEELIECHDLTVDYILTPTRVIRTECKQPKPQGIIWAKLNADMLERIPVLQKLRALEQKSGKDVSLGKAVFPGEAALPGGGRDDAIVDDTAVTTLYLGGVPAGLRVSELKSSLHERRASPQRLIWQGAHGRAFLEYGDHEKAQAALTALQALSINGHNMQVAFARGQRSRRGPGAPHRTAKATESQALSRSLKRS